MPSNGVDHHVGHLSRSCRSPDLRTVADLVDDARHEVGRAARPAPQCSDRGMARPNSAIGASKRSPSSATKK